jgi:ribonuclease P protein component
VANPVDEPPRVAYAIGKRVGGAVERNRVRRRLRNVMADLDPAPGRYLIRVAPGGSELSFLDLKVLVSNALLALPTPEDAPLESSVL